MHDSLMPTRTVLRQKMRRADPVADRLAQAIADHGGDGCQDSMLAAVELLLRTPRFSAPLILDLCHGDPAVEKAFEGFLESTNDLPQPHSDADIEAGNRLFEDNAVFGFVGLGCTSLLECYCWNIEAEVLGMTHGLSQNIARRIPETAMYVLDVMGDRSLLEKGHTDLRPQTLLTEDRTPPGVRAIQKVRLLHALIRWLIKFDPKVARDIFSGPLQDNPFVNMLKSEWPVKDKGEPISQAFLAGTLLTFSLTIIRSLRRMLISLSEEEAKQYLQRWKAIGFKLGIDDDLLAYFDSEVAATHLHTAMMAEFRGSTSQGKVMAAALENFMIANIVDRVPFHRILQAHRLPRVVMWHLAGKDTCCTLDMEPGLFGKTFGWLGWQMLRCVGFLERVPVLTRFSRWVFEKLGRVMWGWRRADDQAVAVSGAPTVSGTAPPLRRGVVIGSELADRWGVPRGAP